ncbi:hypothetical protein [Jiulongibacter sp. NS-SX5]
MKKNNIFKIAFVLFLAIVLYVLYDMSSQTTGPWNKDKQLERVLPE